MSAGHAALPVVHVGGEHAVGVLLNVVVGVLVIHALVIHHLHGGRVVEAHPNGVALVLVEAHAFALALREVDVGCEFEPFVEACVEVGLHGVALELRFLDDALVFHVVARHIELHILVTLGEGEFVVLLHAGAQKLVHPVDAGVGAVEVGGEGIGRHAFVVHEGLSIFAGAHYLGNVVSVREANVGVEDHLRLAGLTALGGDEHHAVGTARTVDGGARCVLEHLHALNVLGADAVEAALTHNAVDHVEGVVALVDGACAAYTYLEVAAGHAARHHRDTGNAALQSVLNAGDGLVLERLVVHHSHRACEVGLTHGAVTNDYGLVQVGRGALHGYVEAVAAHLEFAAGIAYARENHRLAFGCTNAELTLAVGHGAGVGAAHGHRYAFHGFAVLVGYASLHLVILLVDFSERSTGGEGGGMQSLAGSGQHAQTHRKRQSTQQALVP